MATKSNNKFFTNQYGSVYGAVTALPIGRILYPALDKPNTKFSAPGELGDYGFRLLIPKNAASGVSQKILDYNKKMIPVLKSAAEMTIMEHAKPKLFHPLGMLKDGDKMLDADGNPNKLYARYYVVTCAQKLRTSDDLEKKRIKTVKITPNNTSEAIPASMIEGGMLVRVFGQLLASTPPTGAVCSFKPQVVQLIGDDGVRIGGGRVDPVAALDASPITDSLLAELVGSLAPSEQVVDSLMGESTTVTNEADDDDGLISF